MKPPITPDGRYFVVRGGLWRCSNPHLSEVRRDDTDRKSIMASCSFGRPVTTCDEMKEAVATYAARAAEKMRRQGLATASIAAAKRAEASWASS